MDGEVEKAVDQAFALWLDARDGGPPLDLKAMFAANPAIVAPLKRLIDDCLSIERASGVVPARPPRPAVAEDGFHDVGCGYPIPAGQQDLFEQLIARANRYRRYKVGEEIGRGGMGVVAKAEDTELSRPVAIKRLRLKHVPDSSNVPVQVVSYFVEEARITGQLDHPAIVPVHELGIDQTGELYFVMKYVNGTSLDKVLDARRQGATEPSLDGLLKIMVRVCEAVGYAHERRVVHRDLKPHNIMVGKHGKVYVMDWGIARVLDKSNSDLGTTELQSARRDLRAVDPDSDELSRNAPGSLFYMSPEHASGNVDLVAKEADSYALGVILYQIVSGIVPYADLTPRDEGEWKRMIASGKFTPITELVPKLRPELAAIINRALSLDPAQRYPSAAELGADLDAYLDGGRVRAYESGADAVYRRLLKASVRTQGAAPSDDTLEAAIRQYPDLADDLIRLHSYWKKLSAQLADFGVNIPMDSVGDLTETENVPTHDLRDAGAVDDRAPHKLDLEQEIGLEASAIYYASPEYNRRVFSAIGLEVPKSLSGDRYRIGKQIAVGGFARIFTGHDRDLHRKVVIRLLKGNRVELAQRFIQSTQIQAQIQHPNVLPIYDAGARLDGLVYSIMPYASGLNLAQWIEHRKLEKEPLTSLYEQAAQALRGICGALAMAHQNGVVHRDVKPHNIMMARNGQAYLLDWDLAAPDYRRAKAQSPVPSDAGFNEAATLDARRREHERETSPILTHCGSIIGTPAYMAPQQAEGLDRDPRDDVYSLGATLYHVVAGHVPYMDGSRSKYAAMDVIDRVLRGPPQKLHTIRPDASRDLVAICERAMARRREDRYQTADEMGRALEEWLDSAELPAWRRWLRRRSHRS